MSDNVDDFLAHYGVPGMKWGKRKAVGSKQRTHVSQDARRAATLRKKQLSQLSNDDLKKLNARNELESKWRKANPTSLERGKRRAKTIIANATTIAGIYTLATSPAAKAGAKAVRNMVYRYNYATGRTLAITK